MTHAACYLGTGEPEFRKVSGNQLQPCDRQDATNLIVVIDATDETQTVSSMPRVRGSGNAAQLRRRRLEREFPGITLKTVLPYRRRDSEGVTDVVLMSTDSTGAMTPTLTQLCETAAIRGVYTPAILAAHWMALAGQHHRKVVIVMPTPAGMRLIFMDRCCPLLSRLVPQMAPESLAIEIARTIQYLHNTQRLQRGTSLELWFWGMDEGSVSASLPAGDNYELGAAPRVPNLPDPETGGLDALLLLGITRPPARQLAPHDWRAGWYAQVARRWSQAAAAAAVMGGAIAVSLLLADVGQVRAANQDALMSDAAYQEQRLLLEEGAARAGLTADELVSLPMVAATILSSQVTPVEAMNLAARTLGSRRELMIQSLEFQSGTLGAETPATSGGCTTDAAPGAPVFEATFRLAEGLEVRAGSEALAHVRRTTAAASPWQSTAASSGLGELQSLTVQSTAQGMTSDAEWLTCMWRGESS
jgi:hypothetical protein